VGACGASDACECVVQRTWFMVQGAWCMTRGARCMVQGACVACGAGFWDKCVPENIEGGGGRMIN
jgi:hypothetical protein